MTSGDIKKIVSGLSFKDFAEARKLVVELQNAGEDDFTITAILYKLGMDQGKRIERARRVTS